MDHFIVQFITFFVWDFGFVIMFGLSFFIMNPTSF